MAQMTQVIFADLLCHSATLYDYLLRG